MPADDDRALPDEAPSDAEVAGAEVAGKRPSASDDRNRNPHRRPPEDALDHGAATDASTFIDGRDPWTLRAHRAHLVTPRLLTWPDPIPPGAEVRLHLARDGRLQVAAHQADPDGPLRRRIVGADAEVVLRPDPGGLTAELTARDGYRHLAGRTALHLDAGPLSDEALCGQLVVSVTDAAGELVAAAGVQMALALDARFATDAPLGVRWAADGTPSVAVWAPTARRVAVQITTEPSLGDAARARTYPLTRGERGVWSVTADERWLAPLDASGDPRRAGGPDHLDAGPSLGAAGADHLDAGPDRAPAGADRGPAGADRGPAGADRAPAGADRHARSRRFRGLGYRYVVEVYEPVGDEVATNLVTDPWSVGLSADGRWSLLLDLDDLADPALAPAGWARGIRKPTHPGQHRMVAYELHIRDHSTADPEVTPGLRGTYLAFTLPRSAGTRHLASLAEAGVSHLHLLPFTDLASIRERRADQILPDIEVPDDPASDEPQRIQQAGADHEPYNWGYDPHHWLVPEGAYATDPDGPTRVREARAMVAAINRLGLRVVLDLVCNHTYRAGQHRLSVLDRIVPGYYHRLDDLGRITTSTCCPNTATEHAMMERLIIDAVRTWARAYRVDGFRIDLLGHHPAAQARRIRTALDALTLERDGVDGRSLVLYGEGWEFGEVAGDARFLAATQRGLAGSGIGTFDDRLRDALRGGSHAGARSEQGVASGLWWEPNGRDDGRTAGDGASAGGGEVAGPGADGPAGPGDVAGPGEVAGPGADGPAGPGDDGTAGGRRGSPASLRRALELTDLVRLGVAGELAAVEIPCHDGDVRRGDAMRYGNVPAGYASVPTDQVAYVSAHDNETLFDALAAKLPLTTSMADRVRMQVVALAPVLLGQGTPFLHAGCELLRSKSLDRNSYRSGDWFNQLDWTATSTRWGVGLPPAAANPDERDLLRHLLRSIPAPEPADIAGCRDRVLELLRVRQRSTLFGLATAAEVRRRLRFHLTGRDAVPGQVVWTLHGGGRTDHDLLLAVNAAPKTLRAPLSALDLTGAAPASTPRSPDSWTGLHLDAGAGPAGDARRPDGGAGLHLDAGDDRRSAPGTRVGAGHAGWRLHPVLARSVDPVVRRAQLDGEGLRVPARTAAVFVRHAR